MASDDILDDFDIIDENELKDSINQSLYNIQNHETDDIKSPHFNIWVDEEQNRLLRISKVQSTTERNHLYKEVVWKGIYSPLRPEIYMFLSGGLHLSHNIGDVWEDIVKIKSKPAYERVIATFGFPDYELYMPNESLQDFLTVIKNQNPEIEFSPMIPSVAALLRLYLDPSKAYNCLQAMINNGNKYFTHTKQDFANTLKAIECIVINISKKLSDFSKSLKLNISDVSLFIIPLLFTTRVDKNFALTIFDAFVYEGRKVLVKYMVGILMILQRKLLRTESAEEFMSVIIRYITNLYKPQELDELAELSFTLHTSKKKKMAYYERKAETEVNDLNYKITNVLPTIEEFGAFREFSQLTSATAGSLTYMGDRRSKNRVSIKQMMNSNSTHNGKLLTGTQFDAIRSKFPTKFRHLDAYPLFLMSVDGASMTKLIQKSEDYAPCMIVIVTPIKTIGAVLSDAPSLQYRGRYYGSAMTCVFDINEGKVYKGTLKNDYFISVSNTSFCVGGGDGIAIYLNNNFETVLSAPCETFNSPPFFDEDQYVKVDNIELYKLAP